MTDKEIIARAMSIPSGYATVKLGLKLHPVQSQVLDALFEKDKSKIIFKCGNEVGKTKVVCVSAILYALDILDCVCISTSATFRQVSKQLVPYLREHSSKYPNWEFLDNSIKINGETRYLGFSASDDTTIQGWHATDKHKLLVIVDEAAGVEDTIFHGISRHNASYLLICGSPKGPEKFFYSACTDTETMKPFKHFSLNKLQCLKPDYWLDKKDIDDFIQMWGSTHPLVLSSVFGEFSQQIENGILSLVELERCYNHPPLFKPGQKHVALDFAAGGDNNVISLRDGNKIEIIKSFHEPEPMRACDIIAVELNELRDKHGIRPCDVSGDADGLGIGFISRLKDLGWNINHFHGGSIPNDPTYGNRISECWLNMAKQIRDCSIILPSNNDFKLQILSRKQSVSGKGKLNLESKKDMKARGIHSPDEADVVAMCLSNPQSGNVTNVPKPTVNPKVYKMFA